MARRRGDGLTSRQAAGLSALLASPSINAAAESSGIPARTLRSWLCEKAFAKAHGEAKARLVEEVLTGLLGSASAAVEALTRNLTAERPTDQIKAATALLTHLLHVRDAATTEQRLRAIEAELAARRNRG